MKKKKPADKFVSNKKDRLISFLVFAFAFLLYANTLNHGYVLDDDIVYLKNKDVQAGFGGIKNILSHSFIYGFTGHNDQSYRPVVLIIYAIEKEIFGNNPHAGHFTNVLLFAFSCLLLYKLLQKMFIKIHGFSIFHSSFAIRDLSFIIALLFVSHPIHTEAVANIKGRDDILNFIFLELSLLFILKFIDEKANKHLILSVLFFFFSLLCKEIAVTFMAIIPLTVFFFREVPIKKIAILSIPFVVTFGVYMLIRSSVLETITFAEKMKIINNTLVAATNESDRIATAIFILGKYISLLFFPLHLSWDYSYNQIPIMGFSDVKVIITLLVFAGLGFYVLKTFHRKDAVAYCILFFFITMLVVSNIFIMIGATLGERFLFTSSLAFCIAIPILLMRFGKNVFYGIVCVMIFFFSFKTFDRNNDWKDNFSLFTSGAKDCPNSSRVQSAMGSAYREQAERETDRNKRIMLFQKALEHYNKATAILPENTEALYNAGVSYYGIGDGENALRVYQQTLKYEPGYTSAANNLGVIFFERKDYSSAKKYFTQAISYDSNNADALGNLGAINHNLGDLKTAISFYERALNLNPNNQNILSNLQKAKTSLNSMQQNQSLK
ncbi:MAG: tetratricopeptide repeat protein [Bacteroidota bacterium]